jgi:hypothetical protein
MNRMSRLGILYILLQCINTQALSQGVDSLAKYSYYVFAFTTDCKYVNGVKICRMVRYTAFIVQKNNKIYLVSAAHSFFDLQHKGQKPLSYIYPTHFQLRLYNKTTHLPETIDIDVSNKRPASNYFYSNPDVYAFEVNIPEKYEINSVEKFFTNNPNDFQKPIRGVSFGYPEFLNHSLSEAPIKCILNTSTYLDLFSATENINESDAALQPIECQAGVGDSGSPLFLILSNSKIIFGGLCIAENEGYVIFVRPKDVMNKLPK